MTSMAFDGEAPETDDEIEEEEEEKIVVRPTETEKKEVLIDKNLEKRWTQVAVETITSCQKRSVNHEKMIQKVVDLAADSFTCMQNVTSKLNIVQTNVTRLEDSVADLVDASKSIPDKFPVFNFKIPEFV